MPAITIDVDAQIENLRGLKIDLEECFWSIDEHAEASTRYALGVAISELSRRMAALEDVARHLGGDEVRVTLSPDESRVLDRALTLLDGEFVADPADDKARMWARVRRLLDAADDLLLATARGTAVRTDTGALRPGIVLPLIRSSR
jgi:hypothetical protein